MGTDLFLAWRDIYSVGNEELDSQHKKMLQLITELHRALDCGQTEQELRRIIQEACDYAKLHFKTEESLLTSCNYPDLPEHRRVHQDYVNRVESIVLLRQACGGRKKPPGEPSARHLAAGRPYRNITQAASASIGGRQRLFVIPG